MSDRTFNLDDYVPVSERITEFWKRFPEGRIETVVEHIDPPTESKRMIVVSAHVYADRNPDSRPIATGLAKEREGLGMANKTAFLENCETSAIGRALANLGLLTERQRPSREEMARVMEISEEHQNVLNEIKTLASGMGAEAKDLVKSLWPEAKASPIVAANLLNDLQTMS